MSESKLQKPEIDAPRSVVKSSIQFFFGTVLSRFTGFFREMALGAWLGASPALAAFFIAYRFSQLLRRLFGESSLLSSFAPHYEELKNRDPQQALAFFRDLFASLSTVLGFIILVLEMVLFFLWRGNFFSAGPREILFLTMVMLPGVLFVCLYALFSALLQTARKYFLPSVAPIFFNLIFLVVLWSVRNWETAAATAALAGGVTLAFLVQWLIVLVSTRSIIHNLSWQGVRLWSPALRKMVFAMSLTIIGIGAVQINSFVDTLFAYSADRAGPAYLYYAIRLYQLPLALFGLALSSALLPSLARAFQVGDKASYLSLLQFALRRSLSFMIPVTIGLWVFGDALVNLVYGRGEFDALAIRETTYCLWGYALGLVPAVLVLILAPAFYARKDYKTPLKASLLSVGLNVLLNVWFIYGMGRGTASVAVATSVAAFLNVGYLYYSLKKEEGRLVERPTLVSIIKITFCAFFAGVMTACIGYFLVGGTAASFVGTTPLFPQHPWEQMVHTVIYGGVFTLLFFSYAWLFKIHEVFQLIGWKSEKE